MAGKSLDTNILLRLLLDDIPEQVAVAKKLISDAAPGQYEVADMIFAEIVWILQGPFYRQDRQQIAENLRAVLGIPAISCNRAMLERAVSLYVKHPSLSFVDVCLTIYAELNGARPLLTFDARLAKQVPEAELLAV